MNVKKSRKDQIKGWIPKESIRISAQTSRTISVFLIALMAVLIVPIFYLVLQASNYLGILWPIIYLAMVLVSRYIINKTGFKTTLPAQSQGIVLRVHRIRIAVASGLLTAFGVGFAARLIIGSLSAYFWIPFIILTIVGALIGDSIWKIFQKRNLEANAK
jgi:hypothetical protein